MVRLFPVTKEKTKKKFIKSLHLERDHMRELAFPADSKGSNERSFASFSTMKKTFGEFQDNIAKVTSKGITVYDKDC